MYRLCPYLPYFIALGCGSLWGAWPGLRYLDEIGHLGTPTASRTSVRYGRTRAVSTGSGNVRFQGRDDNGKAWQAILPIDGGIGFTTIWQADFDRNSRPDILIAAYFPKNGRCIDEITLSFLLFDLHGRPIPWVIQTRMPTTKRFPLIPAIFSSHNDRTELVVTDCEFGASALLGQDRSITGIYEARDARWNLVRPTRLDAYRGLVRHRYRFSPDADRLLPTKPSDWLDQGNAFAPTGPVQVKAVLPASPSCRGAVHLPPIIDGAFQRDWKDPCNEIGKNRFQLSDGTTCYGWPTVMLDRGDKREIVAESELTDLEPLLREVAAQHITVVLTGQKEPGRCSPALLWARVPQ